MTACAIEGETTGAATTVSLTSEEAGEVEEPERRETAEASAGREKAGGPRGSSGAERPEGVGAPARADASAGAKAPAGDGGPGETAEPGAPGGPGALATASAAGGVAARAGTFTIAADGSYAARLTRSGAAGAASWFPERWTLDGYEPYAVPLPLGQPEEPDSEVLPLSDGRVLIRRRVADRHTFSLLYPTGPGTGELPLGAVECVNDAPLTLLPPSPDGSHAYALSVGEQSTAVWLVAGGVFGPERVADIPGRCSGGAWLDRTGHMLALDREPVGGGPVKAVAVDLGRGGEVTPLLQIAPDSNDRLLLAEPDSGLLLIRSDAPGHDRLGWGVLGSSLPVRFPECLRPADVAVTPFAVQPGQVLMPESCAVALRIDGAAGSWVGVWRPAGRRLHQLPVPEGWLAGSGLWTRDGVLKLPYANGDVPCGVALVAAPVDEKPGVGPAWVAAAESGMQPSAAATPPAVCKPVPLGQAPLVGRTAPV
ncbi:hypothetical protein LRD69_08475 [Streptomyces sp. JH14]|uniref:hypothetical protein n=1 Tax=Streptomyces sp. JH14 TaxID=2793630 RepID=UPI0023F9B088|nr:hypothetical protein [Streptomyces sp. JH14]MDF6042197.1 hypothetical protein [Streptomyces sp. JH14]